MAGQTVGYILSLHRFVRICELSASLVSKRFYCVGFKTKQNKNSFVYLHRTVLLWYNRYESYVSMTSSGNFSFLWPHFSAGTEILIIIQVVRCCIKTRFNPSARYELCLVTSLIRAISVWHLHVVHCECAVEMSKLQHWRTGVIK